MHFPNEFSFESIPQENLIGRQIFWIIFKQANGVAVIIQPAGDIIAARMRAILAGVAGEFQEGHELDATIAKKVPKRLIGRALSRQEATALLKSLDK